MVDYKMKYKEMKAKMLESIDVSYRLGYEQGYKEATQEAQQAQMQQQMQQAQMMQQAAMGGQQDPNAMVAQEASPDQQAEAMGQEMSPEMQGGMPMQGQEMGPEEELEGSQANELDQYLAELESMVSKGQKPSVIDLRKAVTTISNIRKIQKEKMRSNKQQVISAQKSIVDNLIKKWTVKTEETSEDIEKLIREKGIEI